MQDGDMLADQYGYTYLLLLLLILFLFIRQFTLTFSSKAIQRGNYPDFASQNNSMVWSQIEATPSHLTYLLLSTFLIIYALFSEFIRNRLHISEPPLATLLGIVIGPKGTQTLSPRNQFLDDGFTQEVTRIIVGVQVFAVGIELPKAYLSRHWKSVGMMLGPVMTFSFLITALFVYLILRLPVTTCLIISACLAPTDPVLAASVLAESHFSNRVRIIPCHHENHMGLSITVPSAHRVSIP